LIDDAIGDEDLDVYIGVLLMKAADYRREYGIDDSCWNGNSERARDACQMIRGDVRHCILDARTSLSVLKDFRTNVRETEPTGGALDQPHAQLFLKLSDPAANCRNRHAQPMRGSGEAVALDNMGEHHKRIHVGVHITGNSRMNLVSSRRTAKGRD
jgi:hypothetical protein